MEKLNFCCPKCSYSKIILEGEIPKTASQCKCPKCEELLSLSEAIKPLDSSEPNDSISIEQAIEENFENIKLSTYEKKEKEAKALDRYFELFNEGLSLLGAEETLEAMLKLEEAEKLNSTPRVRSYLAYCRVKNKYEFADAIRVCSKALKEEPRNAEHYLNLGRIYILVNQRGAALKAFRKGIKLGPHDQLMQELRKFEKRHLPIFSSLHRDHFLNRGLGKLFSRLRLR